MALNWDSLSLKDDTCSSARTVIISMYLTSRQTCGIDGRFLLAFFPVNHWHKDAEGFSPLFDIALNREPRSKIILRVSLTFGVMLHLQSGFSDYCLGVVLRGLK